MTEFSKPKPQAGPRSHTERYGVYYRTPDGGVGCTSTTSENTARSLQKAVNDEDMTRIDRYQQTLQKKPDAATRFRQVFARTECLICRDEGVITLQMIKNGRSYPTAAACSCAKSRQGAGDIQPLISQGLYQPVCCLASEAAQCPLPRKESKCLAVSCPKFDREETP